MCSSDLLAWAGHRAADIHRAGDSTPWVALIDQALDWRPVALPVGGADVVSLGVAPGPRVGELLGAVERWWIEGDFQAGREAALDRLKTLVAEAPS